MSERRRRFENFALYDYQGVEAHLSRMAAKGWRLEKAGNSLWTYRQAEPLRSGGMVLCLRLEPDADFRLGGPQSRATGNR